MDLPFVLLYHKLYYELFCIVVLVYKLVVDYT